MGARVKYHRLASTMGGTATSQATASSGAVRISAASTSTAVTAAMIISGTAWRTAHESRSTSVVARVTRSPVPARSTAPRGSATARVEEVLAQVGEDPLAEDGALHPRPAREQRLHDDRTDEDQRQVIDL